MPRSGTTSTRSTALILLFVFLTGCKVVVSPGKGGSVQSTSGDYFCASGKTCVYKVADTDFDEEFIAVPDDGYEFLAWKTGNGYFCGLTTNSCSLSTAEFGGNPGLMSVLNSDRKFYLEPLFVPKSTIAFAEDVEYSLAFALTSEFAIVLSANTETVSHIPGDLWILLPDGTAISYISGTITEISSTSPQLNHLPLRAIRPLINESPVRQIERPGGSVFRQELSRGGLLSTDCSDPYSIPRSWDELIGNTFDILRESDSPAAKGIVAPLLLTSMVCEESKSEFSEAKIKSFAEALGVRIFRIPVLDKIDRIVNDWIGTVTDAVTVTVNPQVDCLGEEAIGIVSCAGDIYDLVEEDSNWIDEEFATFSDPIIDLDDVTIDRPVEPEEPECTANVGNLLKKTFRNGTSGTAPFDLSVSVDTNTYCDKGASSSWTLRKNGSVTKTGTGLQFSATLRDSGTYYLEHTVRSDGKVLTSDTTTISVSPGGGDSGALAGTWYLFRSATSPDTGEYYEDETWLDIRGGPNVFDITSTGYSSTGTPFRDPGEIECTNDTVRRVGSSNDFTFDGDDDYEYTYTFEVGSSGNTLTYTITFPDGDETMLLFEKVSSDPSYCP